MVLKPAANGDKQRFCKAACYQCKAHWQTDIGEASRQRQGGEAEQIHKVCVVAKSSIQIDGICGDLVQRVDGASSWQR